MRDELLFRQAVETSRALTRRRFLRTSGLAAGAAGLAPLLAACGSDSDSDSASGDGGAAKQDTKNLYFANWPAYIDEETVDLFEKASGISFKYTEEYNDNNEYFAKIQPLLSKGRSIDPDMLAPTFWMAGRLISLGWVDKLPLDKIPNAKNLRSSLQKPTWDPTGEYSLPWQSGFAGIAYNEQVTGRALTSIDDLWDPAFKGKIGVLSEMRDTLGLIGLSEGVDISKPTAKSLQKAIDALQEQVDSGQIKQFTGNDYMDDLTQGNFAACIGWSGDIAQLSKDSPELKFVIPESGGTLWSDTMVIPQGSDGVTAAAEFMDYVYDPVNAARIAAYVQYVSPVEGVQDELRKLGGDSAALADNELLFPTEASSKNLSSFGPLSEADEEALDAAFSKVQGN
ncbi:MAG: spermidine/putrescine ABC transporter substrate-binding protein [Microthrixaceae bacterium]|jgi:spermidine/putrescine transport system substrate-binding protein|nr:spermidine/putrescine ABC transporter substrate-binding protein [Microthrixaceae bacterium]HMT23363.1 spermidine/putrescine ABC transporter substrate-binding protein [Microthrixaceae bacterium]HMT59512.1 spermidine/putrescine ABC transporter substrate-binding protein [Microthrixaceae bacterium]